MNVKELIAKAKNYFLLKKIIKEWEKLASIGECDLIENYGIINMSVEKIDNIIDIKLAFNHTSGFYSFHGNKGINQKALEELLSFIFQCKVEFNNYQSI